MSRNPVCYNGDIFTLGDYRRFRETFPSVEKVMIGRGLLVNPALVQEIRRLEQGNGGGRYGHGGGKGSLKSIP